MQPTSLDYGKLKHNHQLHHVLQCRLLYHAYPLPNHPHSCPSQLVASRSGNHLGNPHGTHGDGQERETDLRSQGFPRSMREQCLARHDDASKLVLHLSFILSPADAFFSSALVHTQGACKAHGVLPFLSSHRRPHVWRYPSRNQRLPPRSSWYPRLEVSISFLR